MCGGCMSIHCWGLISYEMAGMLYCTEEHLEGLHCQHSVTNIMVPSIQLLYHDKVIQFWQNNSLFHDSCVVQEWLLVQADIKLLTGYHEQRIWTTSRIHGMKGRKLHRNVACSLFKKLVFSGHCVICLGCSCLLSSLFSLQNWVYAGINAVHGWSSRILYIVLRMPCLESSFLKG